jgi:hypothetical protein
MNGRTLTVTDISRIFAHGGRADFRGFVKIDDCAAERLASYVRHREEIAERVKEEEDVTVNRDEVDLDLYFPDLIEISYPVAAALAESSGHLAFERASLLDARAARALINHKGGSIEIGGPITITDSLATILSKHRGILALSGTTEISDWAASLLAKQKGFLGLKRVSKLSDSAAESLGMHTGAIDLSGLNSVSDAVVKLLAKHEGNLKLKGIEKLSEDAADALSRHDGILEIHGRINVGEKAGDLLATHKDDVRINDIETLLSAKLARKIIYIDGDKNFLSGCRLPKLSTINEDVAIALASYPGTLDLSGITSLTTGLAKTLAAHRNHLALRGITSLSCGAARALGRHKFLETHITVRAQIDRV